MTVTVRVWLPHPAMPTTTAIGRSARLKTWSRSERISSTRTTHKPFETLRVKFKYDQSKLARTGLA